MAGFSLFNYSKEGPGIDKNAPNKRTFIVFFETFFRNIWKFMSICLLYSLISLPQVTSGLAAAGMTNVARNTARDKHSFGLSDFFETIRKNWKQALPMGIINTVVYAVIFFDFWFFLSVEGTNGTLGLALAIALFFIYTVMNYFIWTLMITFKFSIKQILKNSFKFVFINLKNNFICFIANLAVIALYVGLLFLFSKWWVFVLIIELIVYTVTYPTFKYLLVQYCVFPSIKKYIIDPYYEEHPDEDLDKRRDLGVYVDEPEADGEEDTDGEFDD